MEQHENILQELQPAMGWAKIGAITESEVYAQSVAIYNNLLALNNSPLAQISAEQQALSLGFANKDSFMVAAAVEAAMKIKERVELRMGETENA